MTDETLAEGSAVGACGDRLPNLFGQAGSILCHLAVGHVGMHTDGVTQWTVRGDIDAEVALLRKERADYRNALWQLASDVSEVIDDMESFGGPRGASYPDRLRAAIVAAKPEFLP